MPTNPVHVLDFAFFLPAAFLTGLWLLRRRPFAFTVAPAFIVFVILTGMPILLTPVLQAARGEAASWGVVIPIGTLTLLMLALLVWLSSTVQPQKRGLRPKGYRSRQPDPCASCTAEALHGGSCRAYSQVYSWCETKEDVKRYADIKSKVSNRGIAGGSHNQGL